MTTTYQYIKTGTRESLVVSGSVVRTVASTNPNFAKVRDYCFNTDPDDLSMNEVLKLIDAGSIVVANLLRVTDRVSYKGGDLLWDGVKIENALSSHIVRMIKNGDENYPAFARFMENLANNPSQDSRDSLFEWVADRDLTITEDGCFVGYKGVRSDYGSLYHGYGVVNGVEQTGNLDNTPGNIVEVPRNRVDEDRNSACSYGLHVGTQSYAQSYASGGRMIIVAVNPRDVVMVPRDGGGEKMRVCKYVVLADNEKEVTETTYTGQHRVEEDPSFCAECDCELEDGSCACCNDDSQTIYCDECDDVEVDEAGDVCEDCAEDQAEDEDDETEDEEEEVCPYDGAPLNSRGLCSKMFGA